MECWPFDESAGDIRLEAARRFRPSRISALEKISAALIRNRSLMVMLGGTLKKPALRLRVQENGHSAEPAPAARSHTG